MVQKAHLITEYMQNMADDEVFILLELKHNGEEYLNYNYYCKGESRDMLMAIGEIVEKESLQMGITFDQTVEVLKNMHYIRHGICRTRTINRIAKDWTVLEEEAKKG